MLIRKPTCKDRAELYAEANPKHPPLAYNDEWITGTWAIGSCYKNDSSLYGAYPRGYLDRVHCMFPDGKNVLHVFSGSLNWKAAKAVRDKHWFFETPRAPASDIELVDIMGPEEGRFPTWQGDLFDMPKSWHGRFDLILADPPYSRDDAEKYGTKMVNRRQVTHHLRDFARPGGSMVWLDTTWPMHRKDMWKTWGHVGLVRSTNHRMRLVTFFEAV